MGKSKRLVFIVCVVLGLAASLSFYSRCTRRGSEANTAQNVKNAILSFFTEYQRFPAVGDHQEFDQDFQTDRLLMESLLGATESKENPRGIALFTSNPAKLNPDSSSGKYSNGLVLEADGNRALVDYTGNYYRVRIDANGDGKVYSPLNNEPLSESVIVWGAGRDGLFETWKDNVKTW